jgi:hypothetical protein
MLLKTLKKEWIRRRDGIYIRDRGERHTICDWVREVEGDGPQPWVDETQYAHLLEILPDDIASKLQRARDERAGKAAIYQAGFGYVDLLATAVVDGTAIASSSAEARLVPATRLPANFLAPQAGVPGKTLRGQLRGRGTTLTTGATMTFRLRGEATDVITGTAWAASGAIAADATAQTNTQWEIECGVTVRGAGTTGSVFALGDCDWAWAALTIASQQNKFMGSAGSAAPAAVTKDTSAETFLNWTGQWSLATAYSIQAHRYMLEALN